MSSPQNSIRTGCSSAGENRSRIPPLQENCPGPSTCSVRSYPQRSSASRTSSRGTASPTFSVNAALRRRSAGTVRCSRAETDATVTGAGWPSVLRPASACRAVSRCCSVLRDAASAGRKLYSRMQSVCTGSRSMLLRSRAKFSAAVSSAVTTKSGFSSRPASAAARFALCTAERPETSAGSPPLSKRSGRAASSLCVKICSTRCLMR